MIGWKKKRCNKLVKACAEIVNIIGVKTKRIHGTEPGINNKGISLWEIKSRRRNIWACEIRYVLSNDEIKN